MTDPFTRRPRKNVQIDATPDDAEPIQDTEELDQVVEELARSKSAKAKGKSKK